MKNKDFLNFDGVRRTALAVLALAPLAALTAGCSPGNTYTAPTQYKIQASIVGLTGAGLKLSNAADAGHAATEVTSGNTLALVDTALTTSPYQVSIASQPAGQYCYVSAGGSGVVNLSDVTATVTCAASATTYTVGGTVTGLNVGSSVTLLDNGGNNVTISNNGGASVSFTFADSAQSTGNQLPSGAVYDVTVLAPQPTGQLCYATAGAGGVIAAQNVGGVVVTCAAAPAANAPLSTIGGTVNGLSGSGPDLVLQNNLNDTIDVAPPGSGTTTTFTFPQHLPAAAAYNVTVLRQPKGQFCYPSAAGGGTLSSAGGQTVSASVTCVADTVPTYKVSGTLNGLTAAGLILQDFGGDNLTVAANATTFTFASALPTNVNYSVGVFQQPTGLTCILPAQSGGPTSSPVVNCSPGNPVPSLTSISPTTVTAGGPGFLLLANGSNFISTSTINWNGTALPTTYVNGTQLTATVPGSDIAVPVPSPNPANVTVFNPQVNGAGGGTSAPLTLTIVVNNPAPTITSFSPASAGVAGAAFPLTITGTNFIASSSVSWTSPGASNATPLTVTSQNGTQLIVTVPAADIAAAGTATVTVTNPTPGGGTATQQYTINPANQLPSITSLSPTGVSAGSAGFTLTVNGGNFVAGSTVIWNNSNLPTTFSNANQLTAQVPAADVLAAGSATITVFNPAPGGGTSSGQTFTITPATASKTLLGILSNAASGSPPTYTYTLSLFDVSTSFNPINIQTLNVGPGAAKAYGLAIDASNNVYYLTDAIGASGSATLNYCAAPPAGSAYACTPASGIPNIPGGQWLAVDAAGNIYATQFQAASGSVVQFNLAHPTPVPVYTASASAAGIAGLAVTPDGTALYVSESTSTAQGFGNGITVHLCTAVPCTTVGGTDITFGLEQSAGAGAGVVSGAVAVGGPGGQYFYAGYGDPYGSGAGPVNTNMPVVVVCPSKLAASSTICVIGRQNYPLLGTPGFNSPYVQTAAVAGDAPGNTYAAAILNSVDTNTGTNMSLAGDPGLFGFTVPSAGGGSLTNCLPGCPLASLPQPPTLTTATGTNWLPYSMAITVQ